MVVIRQSKQQILDFPVQRYKQGGREVYSLVLDLGTLDGLLPEDVDPDQIKDANRRFNKDHSKRIEEYLYETDQWVLGSILLGINPSYCSFEPYYLEDGEPSDTMGQLLIPLVGGRSSLRILDGQHRRKAIQQVRKRLEQEILEHRELLFKNGKSRSAKKRLEDLEAKLSRLDSMSVSVMIYQEADIKKLRRMFADLAKTRNIEAITKARFDDRNPFNRAAQVLAELDTSDFLKGRVEMERDTPSLAGNNLLSLNQLSRCLVHLKFGYGARLSHRRIQEVDQKYNELVDLGMEWADDFLPTARKEYEILLSSDLEEDYVSKNRSKHLAYSTSALQMLAGCLHEWNKRERPWSDLATWVRKADFELNSEDCIFLKKGMLIPGDTSLIARRQNVDATIDYVVEQAAQASG
ncbi:MAG: DGQHR domain-containing protein [Anaerolineaceae bacterium]|nr:DGQHR domain-containing protein [Anaerolineaceae bacterium]MDE0328709.1 DGQHR domain-containing protein [Anaerolineaceae bacterium]